MSSRRTTAFTCRAACNGEVSRKTRMPARSSATFGSAGFRWRESFQLDAFAMHQTFACLCNSPDELRIMFQSIIEPFVLRSKAHQHARGPSMPCDDNLLGFRNSKVFRQLILLFRQSHQIPLAHEQPRRSGGVVAEWDTLERRISVVSGCAVRHRIGTIPNREPVESDSGPSERRFPNVERRMEPPCPSLPASLNCIPN